MPVPPMYVCCLCMQHSLFWRRGAVDPLPEFIRMGRLWQWEEEVYACFRTWSGSHNIEDRQYL